MMMSSGKSRRLWWALGLILVSLLAHAQSVTLTPTTLSFGYQIVSTTSAGKYIVLTNGQSISLTISSIATSGDYAETNNCGNSLAANTTCTITVTFTPTITGSRPGTLTVTDSASNSPQTASLSGSGVLPVMLTPGSANFGNEVVGTTSAPVALNLKNYQTVPLNISSIATTGDYSQTNSCGSTVPPITSCSISATFSPTTTGTRPGALTVTDDASNSPQTANFTGVGAIPSTISSLSPLVGPVGTIVTLRGSGFGATQGSSTISFNGTTATPSAWNATSIRVPAPTGATTGNVVVTVAGAGSNGVLFTVGNTPSISNLSTTSGQPGSSVTINGANFGAVQGGSTVTFNGSLATATSWTAGAINITVPAGAQSGNVVVTVGGFASNGVAFTVTLPTPTITSIIPSANAVGGGVTLYGTNFGSTQGTSAVTFNNIAASITYWSSQEIIAEVPLGAQTGNVVVTVAGVASTGYAFTVSPTPAPYIASISTNQTVAVGEPLTVYGGNFGTTQGSSTLTLAGQPIENLGWSSNSISFQVPAGATSGNLVVTVGGVASNSISLAVNSNPGITSISPTSGPIGTLISIYGANFGSTQGSVWFNNVPASPSSWTSSLVQVPVPSGASTGYVAMQVGALYAQGSPLFTLAPATITSISPTSGPVGEAVTIVGATFGSSQGLSSVSFNGTVATVIQWSNTSITVEVPANATTGNVVVTVGGLASNGQSFTITSGPGITSLYPTSGSVGNTVVVTGAGFGSTQGSISFNGIGGTPSSWSPTSIGVPVPSGATSGSVVVTVGGTQSNGVSFSVITTPIIDYLSQSRGPVGFPITITGSNFGPLQNGGSVTFNGITAPVSNWSSTSISVTVPANATTGSIVVTVGGVASNGVNFTVNNWAGVLGISPTVGPPGTTVSISGLNFGSVQGSSSVTFYGVTANVQNWSSSAITVTVPSLATTGDLSVSIPGIGTDYAVSNLFTVDSPPTITSISPAAAPIGATVTITGGNFDTYQNQSTVTFGGTPATEILSWSAGTIVAVVPSGATTGDLEVTVGGIASNASSFTLTPGPGITDVGNGFGQTTGAVGAPFYIYGQGFGSTQDTSTITFNGTTATPTSWSDTYISVPVPSGATSGSIVVTVGGQASNPANFTAVLPAGVSSISPTSAPFGALVTIQGSGFGPGQLVGGERSTVCLSGPGFNSCDFSITSWTDSTIVAAAPSNSLLEPMSGTIAVTTVASDAVSNSVAFTLLPSSSLALSMTPTSGPTGTPVTLTNGLGGFGTSQGSSVVTLNGVAATPTSWTDSSIVVPVPDGGFTGPWNVAVNGVSRTTGGIPFYVTPVITAINPSSGAATTPITITGTGFGPAVNTCGAGSVTFSCPSCGGTIISHAQSWSTNAIVAPVPNLATSGPILVNACGVASNGVNFTVPTGNGSASGKVTSTNSGVGIGGATVTALQGGVVVATTTTGQSGSYSFLSLVAGTYDVQFAAAGYSGAYLSGNSVTVGVNLLVNAVLSPTPFIASLSQTWGPAGTSITISGVNFGGNQSLYSGAVTFNGVNAIPITWSNTSIVVPVPSTATTGPVIVSVAGNPSNAVNFSVGSGTLSGTVENAANGLALPGAQVAAMQSNVVVGSATTNSGGSYVIPNLGPGSYDLQTSASGFGTEISAGNSVSVGSTTTVNFSLPSRAKDSGTVTQSNGVTPVIGATVTALQNNVDAASTTTDSSGNFSLPNLSAGSYIIQASAQGYDTVQQTASLTAGQATTTNLSLAGQSTISYSYDQVGRLVSVSDSLNGSATYNYDAVGNITSIGRESISQVNILSFSPVSGFPGETVTINGTNFSSNSNQDTVSFNGANASVTSASSNQLAVTVPTGATTGAISVTAPLGTANSSSSFTVTNSSVPAITGFTPAIGNVGAPVSITGTNFDPTPSSNSTFLNTSQMTLGSNSTMTNLSTSIPVNGVSSGRISVTTGAGQAVSASDFYVVPTGYLASSVGFTGRTQLNAGPSLISLANGQTALLLFDATAGESITGATTNSTWNCSALQGEIIDPNGAVLISNSCLGNESFGPMNLTQTGTYSLFILPAQGSGQFDVSFQTVAPNITGILYPTTTGTTLGPLTTQTPGQEYVFAMNGNANSRISLVSWGSYPGCLQATLTGPSGSPVTGFNTCMGTGLQTSPEFSGVITLPQTGSYTLTLAAGPTYTGSLYLIPYSVPADPVVPLPMNGQATVTTTVPGQDGHFTFNITSAQSIVMTFNASASLNCEWWATLYDPNNNQIGQWQGCNNSSINTGTINLTTVGNYSVSITPDGHEPWVIGAFTGTLQP